MRILAAVTAAAFLCACAPVDFNSPNVGLTVGPVDRTYWPVRRDYEYLAKDVAAKCFVEMGVPLRDRTGCIVLRHRLCTYITRPQDDHALREMNAICNGWRPA